MDYIWWQLFCCICEYIMYMYTYLDVCIVYTCIHVCYSTCMYMYMYLVLYIMYSYMLQYVHVFRCMYCIYMYMYSYMLHMYMYMYMCTLCMSKNIIIYNFITMYPRTHAHTHTGITQWSISCCTSPHYQCWYI